MTTASGLVVNEGDVISIDSSTGEVFLGEIPVMPSPVARYFEEGFWTLHSTYLVRMPSA